MNRAALPSRYLARLHDTLARAIEQAEKLAHPVLAAISFDIDPIDPLQVLGAWEDQRTPYLYWEQHELTFFAWGCALELNGHDEKRFTQVEENWRLLRADAVVAGPLAPRLCGGFRFDTYGQREAHWQAFADASLMLANVTVIRQNQQHHVLCQHLAKPGEDALALATDYDAALRHLCRPAKPRALPPRSERQESHSTLTRRQWEGKVAEAVQNIRQGCFGKVVLARTQTQALGDVAPWQIIEQLRLRHDDAQLFACRRGDACFIGASPERLVKVDAGEVITHALAGTISRSGDAQEDTRLGQSLLDSAKDRHEHRLVVEAIRAALAPLSEALEIPAVPNLKRLARIQHLDTPIRARLLEGYGILDLLEALHPTPAVGGYPRIAALGCIRQLEGMDRGWYAAPLGWLDGEGNGDFLVALRSALLVRGQAYLFAGCGLVDDSEPSHEYHETCLKLSAMQEALTAAIGQREALS
ncbi:isochorismate synthase [Salinicola sp. JS01]|uniref:isochorismate synthase n=1 Tax=Salinicola sp. JS01 TaxID=3050071 RepID=UPI00255B9457|nr:isochorismate synthase [Salinicola sp. JS01]WIX32336.1 isochorismate synthase [Salinicola sp. JS01]